MEARKGAMPRWFNTGTFSSIVWTATLLSLKELSFRTIHTLAPNARSATAARDPIRKNRAEGSEIEIAIVITPPPLRSLGNLPLLPTTTTQEPNLPVAPARALGKTGRSQTGSAIGLHLERARTARITAAFSTKR